MEPVVSHIYACVSQKRLSNGWTDSLEDAEAEAESLCPRWEIGSGNGTGWLCLCLKCAGAGAGQADSSSPPACALLLSKPGQTNMQSSGGRQGRQGRRRKATVLLFASIFMTRYLFHCCRCDSQLISISIFSFQFCVTLFSPFSLVFFIFYFFVFWGVLWHVTWDFT